MKQNNINLKIALMRASQEKDKRGEDFLLTDEEIRQVTKEVEEFEQEEN